MLQATRGDLGGLAGYLDARRPQVLQRWRDAVTGDESLDATSDWSLKQLNDHFPDVLEVLGNVLRCWPDLPVSVTTAEHDAAVAHARTRWLQGYSLRGVVREWGHLNSVVVDEIASFRPLASESGFHRIALAAWARVLNDQQALSALEYHELEQAEAETRGAELRRALDALRSIASDRGRAIATDGGR